MDAIDKINTILATKGMTGAELERKIGASNSVYSQWNTRTTKPSKKSLLKVAEALEVDISELIADKEVKKPTENGELTEKQRNIMKHIRKMSDEQLDSLAALLESMIERK